MAVVPDNAPRKRILVVEDDEDLLRMLQHMLVALGRVVKASDGAEALERLQRDTAFDLVVTDLMMPRMDGLALAKRMKADARLAHIPVLMLTAKDTPKDVIAGINAGARHYITKPFKQQELLEKVKRALGG